MTDLTPICALGGASPRRARIGALTLTEEAGLGLASLALARGVSAAESGLDLPGPGGWAATGARAAFWTGPDQWMIEVPGGADRDVAAELSALVPGACVTEQTDGFASFRIDGPTDRLVALMAKLVNIDPRRFGPGSATRTGFHHMSVFVLRRAEDQLAILSMRSAAETMWHALTEAAERQETST